MTRNRRLMGEAVRPWCDAPGRVVEVDDAHWLAMTGVPSPDINMALLWSGEQQVLDEAVATFADHQVPALVMLVGDAVGLTVPEGWDAVGSMPMMSVDLAATPLVPDPRVRPATAEDRDAVDAILVEAYGMSPEVVAVATEVLVTPSDRMRIWLLEDDGVPVSTVTSCRVEDSVSIWCMGTPERHGRKGYGRALLAAVLVAAKEGGATFGLLGATPAGLPLYEATGWTVVEDWQLHTNAVSAQFSH
jgi:GNAT superfamily N-acetyltransferase